MMTPIRHVLGSKVCRMNDVGFSQEERVSVSSRSRNHLLRIAWRIWQFESGDVFSFTVGSVGVFHLGDVDILVTDTLYRRSWKVGPINLV